MVSLFVPRQKEHNFKALHNKIEISFFENAKENRVALKPNSDNE